MNDKHKKDTIVPKDKRKNRRPTHQKDHEKKDKNGKVETKENRPGRRDFKCDKCGGNLIRRWIFPSSSNTTPYTQLQCDNCGTSTTPRDIRYHKSGYVWGTKIKNEDTGKKAG